MVAAAQSQPEGIRGVLPDQSGAFGVGFATLAVHLKGRGVAEHRSSHWPWLTHIHISDKETPVSRARPGLIQHRAINSLKEIHYLYYWGN